MSSVQSVALFLTVANVKPHPSPPPPSPRCKHSAPTLPLPAFPRWWAAHLAVQAGDSDGALRALFAGRLPVGGPDKDAPAEPKPRAATGALDVDDAAVVEGPLRLPHPASVLASHCRSLAAAALERGMVALAATCLDLASADAELVQLVCECTHTSPLPRDVLTHTARYPPIPS